jgi:hypothetical protein
MSVIAPPPAVPLSKQKTFIVEHANILNKPNKLAILRLVILEADSAGVREDANGVAIVLEDCERENPDVITMIYNLMQSRLNHLNTPLGAPVPPITPLPMRQPRS